MKVQANVTTTTANPTRPVGLDVSTMPARISSESLIAELQRLANELERLPSAQDMRDHGEYSSSVYLRRFGSWLDAREAAGLEGEIVPWERKKTPKSELLGDIRDLAEKLGKVPAANDMEEHGPRSPTTYQRRFGSWEAARVAAGFEEPNVYKIREETLLNDLREFAEEFGKTPSRLEMKHEGPRSPCTYDYRFESFGEAVTEAGLEPTPDVLAGEDNPNWKGGYEPYYGPGWPRKRRAARDRDDYQCQSCGMPESEHVEVHGAQLSVHHIQPRRKFDDPSEANELANLVTLCMSCHKRWEGIPLRPQTGLAD